SSDSTALLPLDYTFLSTDDGAHAFGATLNVAAVDSITVTDSANALTDSKNVSVHSAPAASITLAGLPGTVTAGDTNLVSVTAFDVFGNQAKGVNAYTGTVHFSSDDTQAGLPANYTFLVADDGTQTFSVTLKTAGSRTVQAKDT